MKVIIEIDDYILDTDIDSDWVNVCNDELADSLNNAVKLSDVLQEIRQEVNDEFLRCDANAWSDVAKGLLSARCIIDKKIKELVKESEV